MLGRVLGTVGAVAAYGVAAVAQNSAATLITGKLAGAQFENSDASAIAVPVGFSLVNGTGGLLSIALIVVLVLIWASPVIKGFKSLNSEDAN